MKILETSHVLIVWIQITWFLQDSIHMNYNVICAFLTYKILRKGARYLCQWVVNVALFTIKEWLNKCWCSHINSNHLKRQRKTKLHGGAESRLVFAWCWDGHGHWLQVDRRKLLKGNGNVWKLKYSDGCATGKMGWNLIKLYIQSVD